MKIIIRAFDRNGKVKARRMGTRENWKKMYGKLASSVAQKYLVRVEYGKKKNVYGKVENFINEYKGESLKEAKEALSAFIEL